MPFNTTDATTDRVKGPQLDNSASSHSCFEDAYDQTCKFVQASAREVALVTTGTITGAAQEFQKDPVGTTIRAGGTMAVGAGLGALAAAESPVLAVGAITAGATMTGAWAWDTLNPYNPRNQERYSKIGSALTDTWQHGDLKTFGNSLQKMQEGAGPIALDVGLIGLGAKGMQLGARHIPGMIGSFKFPNGMELAPATVPAFTEVRPFYGADDLAFFKTRSGRARVNAGPPETVDARLEAMDKALKINDSSPNKGSGKSSDQTSKILPPPIQDWMRPRPFYFSEKAQPYFR